jgi:hypothetical protein
MRSKKGKSLLKLSWVVGTRALGAVLLVLALLSINGCTKDISNDWVDGGNGEMLFDSTNGIVPTPNKLVMNQKTGTVDLSKAGIPLPKGITWSKDVPCKEFSDQGTCTELQSVACADLSLEQQLVVPIASCDIYKYLTSLDGFPTASFITAPASAKIDTSTVKPDADPDAASRTLLAFALDRTNPTTTKPKVYGSKELAVSSELSIPATLSPTKADIWNLTIKPTAFWEVNKDIFVSVRGYENGIKSSANKTFISSLTYYLLKKNESLTCGKTTGAEDQATCEANPVMITESCPYFTLVEGGEPEGTSAAITSVTLCVLENLRNQFIQLWGAIDNIAGGTATEPSAMHTDSAIAWTFPTHSKSVIEYIPIAYDPVTTDYTNNQITIKVNGNVELSKLKRGGPVYPTDDNMAGTIFLIDECSLYKASIDNDDNLKLAYTIKAFPMFDPSIISDTNEIKLDNIYVLQISTPSNTSIGHLSSDTNYIIFVSKGINDQKQPILDNMVPFMTTVLAKAEDQLYDSDTDTLFVPSALTGLTNATAQDRAMAAAAEAMRYQLAQMFFDNPASQESLIIPCGLTRDNILFVYEITNLTNFPDDCP